MVARDDDTFPILQQCEQRHLWMSETLKIRLKGHFPNFATVRAKAFMDVVDTKN
jgi:hypothetical protein